MQRGLPQSAAHEPSHSIAVLLSSQVTQKCSFISASAPPRDPTHPPRPSALGVLPADWRRLHASHALRHFVAVPLVSAGVVVGALTLAARQGSQPPAAWLPPVLAAAAAALVGLLQPRQVGLAASVLSDVAAVRNVDELVRALRRGVGDMVSATTYLMPNMRLALVRPDGMAAAIFEEGHAQGHMSHARLSRSFEASGQGQGMPEMLANARSTSRRSIDLGHVSAQALCGQGVPQRDLSYYSALGLPPPCGTPQAVNSAVHHLMRKPSSSCHGGNAAATAGSRLAASESGGIPNAPAAAAFGGGSTAGAAAGTLHDRLTQADVSVAGGGSFTSQTASGAGANGKQGGVRGHSLSLRNTLLGEALQKDCGLWISDCTMYMQEARTIPRDIVVSRGSRAVHSLAVCVGRAAGTPVLGAYCVYGSVLPRQLLRAVTLEVEQLLRLLAPCVAHRLSSAALLDEWTYLNEQVLSPLKVDQPKRTPRASALVAEHTGPAGASPGTVSSGRSPAVVDTGAPLPPLSPPAATSSATQRQSPPALVVRTLNAAGFVTPAARGGSNSTDRNALRSEHDAPGAGAAAFAARPHTLLAVANLAGMATPLLPHGDPSLADGFGLRHGSSEEPWARHSEAQDFPMAATRAGSSAVAGKRSDSGALPPGVGAPDASAPPSPSNKGGSQVLASSVTSGETQSGPGGLGLGNTAESNLPTVLAAPSFTVSAVRGALGGVRMAPLVSGLHERLAAAQASRLVYGSAADHMEELAAIEVLDKIGEGGYGEVYRGQYNGSEVAIKIVYNPQGAQSIALPRVPRAPDSVDRGHAAHDALGSNPALAAAALCRTSTGTTTPPARGLHDAFELTVSVSVTHPHIVQVLTFFTDVYIQQENSMASPEQPASANSLRQPLGPQAFGAGSAVTSPMRSRARDAAPAITLLPYPLNNMYSMQLQTVDITAANMPDYMALQAAMASVGSQAAKVVAASPPAMVICMEYCDAGSLSDAIMRGAFRQPCLSMYGASQINMKAVFSTLLEVALALRHLHSLRLVHCDLKPSNVLLRTSPRDPRGFTAKLSDFGLVRLMEPCGEEGRLAIPGGVRHGTVTHMAPEVVATDKSLPHDAALDIYAFGITMWQVVCSGRLYPGVSQADIPHRVAREGMRPRFPSTVLAEYRSLAQACWSASPAARPTAADLVNALKKLMGLGTRAHMQRRYSSLATQLRSPCSSVHGPSPAPPAAGGAGGAGTGSPGGGAAGGGAGSDPASSISLTHITRMPCALLGFEAGRGPKEGGADGGGGAGGGDGAAPNDALAAGAPVARSHSFSYDNFPVHIL